MENKLNKILAEISAGELIDKITILEIKKIKISDKLKIIDVEKELISLNQSVKKYLSNENEISKYKDKLVKINLKLWDLENAKRAAERENEFGKKFIEDSRNVYKLNDERAKVKLAINNTLGSNIKEVKFHQ
tara:strand:+ start:2031 stop:2426 length:396 start_codon:yes stop_codon:yes gene_type:complete